MRYLIQLNDAGAGELALPRADAAAGSVAIGKLIKVCYRGAPVGPGGFYVENVETDFARQGDRGGEEVRVSGRGPLAVLHDGIVWSTTTTTIKYVSKTMAAILLDQITAAKGRGCLAALRCEFSATLDSDGKPWTDTTSIDLRVGTHLDELARMLVDLGLNLKMEFDWYLQDLVFYAYRDATGLNRASEVVLRPGHNCREVADASESGELANALLVEHQSGITSVTDGASAAAYRRRELYYQVGGAPTEGSALVMANAELAKLKDPRRSITVVMHDAAFPPRALVDFEVGDWVGFDRGDGQAATAYRIREMALDWSNTSEYAEITLTLNSERLERELQDAIRLRRLSQGSSASAGSTPVDATAKLAAHDADGGAHAARPLAGDLGGTLGTPVVAGLRGSALANPLTVADGQALVYNGTAAQWEAKDLNSELVPKGHAGTHQSGGGDAIKLDDLAAPDDNTDLDVSTAKHGLAPKLPGDDTKFLNGQGGYTVPAGGGGSIAVEEVDGSPAVAACTKLKFPNGSLVNEGSGVVLIKGAPLEVLVKTVIADVTLTGNGSFDIANIDSAFISLEWDLFGRPSGTTTRDVLIAINNDTTDDHYMSAQHYGGDAHGYNINNKKRSAGWTPYYSEANCWSHIQGLIAGAQAARHKICRTLSSSRAGAATGLVVLRMTHWASTAVVSRLTFALDADSFATGSQLILYGWKKVTIGVQ